MSFTYFSELQAAHASIREELSKAAEKDKKIHEFETQLQELTTRTEQQQQTISILVSEKATLTASVERLQDVEGGESIFLYCSLQLIHLFFMSFIHCSSVGPSIAFSFFVVLSSSPIVVLVSKSFTLIGLFPIILAIMSLSICYMSSLNSFRISCLKDFKSKLEVLNILFHCDVTSTN